MAVSKIGPTGLLNPQVGKNLVDNGGMTVSQRGTITGQGGVSNTYTAIDRWKIREEGPGAARFTTSQDTLSEANSGLARGCRTALKVDCTTVESAVAAGEFVGICHSLEAQNLQMLEYENAGAKSMVLSFTVSSPKSGTHCVALLQSDDNRHYIAEFTVTSADTFEHFSMVIPGDPDGSIDNDTGEGMRITFPLTAGTNFHGTAGSWSNGEEYATSNQQNLMDNTANNFLLSAVQLEVGTLVSDFDHEPVSVTMAKCQRHFIRITSEEDNDSFAFYGSTDTDRGTSMFYTVPMRASPTASLGGTVPNMPDCAGTITSINAAQDDHEHQIQMIHWVVSSATDNQVSRLRFATADTDFIQFSAEL